MVELWPLTGRAEARASSACPLQRRSRGNGHRRSGTNRDIAEATSLSIRTVEGHIYQASSKAGVSSRSELSTLVRQFNGV